MSEPIPITPQSDQGIKDSVINDNFKGVADQLRSNVLKDENGVPILLSGRRPDGTYGFDVSQPGVDVLTADDDELAFSSKFNSFKIAQAGTFTWTLPNGGAPNYDVTWGIKTTTHDHNLGFVPAFLIYITFPAGGFLTGLYKLPFLDTFDGDGSVDSMWPWITLTPSVSSTQITITQNMAMTNSWNVNPIFSFRYYLMQETAA